jgi:hypothetical protein
MRKSRTNANGQAVAKDLHGLMTVNVMSNCISITDRTSVKAVVRASRGWTRSTDIVGSFSPANLLRAHLYHSTVRSEGGQDCQKAQDEAQASGAIHSSGLSSDSMTTGFDSAMSGFSSASISSAPAVFGGNVKAEPDHWGMGVMM